MRQIEGKNGKAIAVKCDVGSEADILADQKLFAAEQAKEQARIEKAEKERQAQFQRLQNATAPWL